MNRCVWVFERLGNEDGDSADVTSSDRSLRMICGPTICRIARLNILEEFSEEQQLRSTFVTELSKMQYGSLGPQYERVTDWDHT